LTTTAALVTTGRSIGVIGAGVMGQTLIRGLIDAGLAKPAQIWATAKSEDTCERVMKDLGIRASQQYRDELATTGLILLLLFACFAWSFYSVPGKTIILRYGTLPITAMSLLIGTLPMLVLASPATIATLHAMTPRQWAELLFLAFVSSFIAMIGWTYATARLPAATVGAMLYVIPVIALMAGALFLGETVTLTTILGGLLILGGVALAQFGPRYLSR